MINGAKSKLAESVTLMVWSRVAMLFAAFMLTVMVPIAGWYLGRIEDSIANFSRSSQALELELAKMNGKFDLLESRQNDLHFRLERLELRNRIP